MPKISLNLRFVSCPFVRSGFHSTTEVTPLEMPSTPGIKLGSANPLALAISIGGLAIAYVTGKIVATAPITPGGLGTVEFALITALTAGGLGAHEAFATVFVYRVVSFFLVALAGWVVFFLFYRGVADIDPDAEPDNGVGNSQESTEAALSSSSSSSTSTTATGSAAPSSPPPTSGTPAASVASDQVIADDRGARAGLEAGRSSARPGAAGMWPLQGRPWRPSGPHDSGPIPARASRESAGRRPGSGADVASRDEARQHEAWQHEKKER